MFVPFHDNRMKPAALTHVKFNWTHKGGKSSIARDGYTEDGKPQAAVDMGKIGGKVAGQKCLEEHPELRDDRNANAYYSELGTKQAENGLSGDELKKVTVKCTHGCTREVFSGQLSEDGKIVSRCLDPNCPMFGDNFTDINRNHWFYIDAVYKRIKEKNESISERKRWWECRLCKDAGEDEPTKKQSSKNKYAQLSCQKCKDATPARYTGSKHARWDKVEED